MEEKSIIKVSIIVPVYNVPESVLRKCIKSTTSQTLEDIEIILVDDGSTDQSGVICDEYALKDKRIKVIHNKNGGISKARNSGYRVAVGKWITFLDSDDWIDEKTCEDNYKTGEEHKVDIVIFGTVQEFGHYKNLFKYHFENGRMFSGDDCKFLQYEVLNFTGNIATAWAKLIKKDLLDSNHIEHNEDLRQGSEGIEFNIRLLEKINSAYFTDNIYYHYIYNPNSISAKHDEKNHYYVIRCFEEIKKNIQLFTNKEKLEKLFYQRFSYVVIAAAISGYFSPSNPEALHIKKKKYENYLGQPLVKECIKIVKINELDKKRSIVWILIKFRFWYMISTLAIVRYKQKHK